MMKYKAAVCAVAALALTVTPLTSASAHYYRHGLIFGLGALGAAVVGTAAAIATAPFVALAPRGPVYYAAPPAYYPPPAYYAPPRAYYAPPPAYYAPPQAYYAPPGYYAPR